MTKKLVTLFFLYCFSSSLCADVIPGRDYDLVADNVRHTKPALRLMQLDPNKVQVVMFFSYACYVCGKISQPFYAWEDKQDRDKIAVRRVPVVLTHHCPTLTKAYYLAESLGRAKEIDIKIFSTLQQGKENLFKEDCLKQFFIANGVSLDNFNKLFYSDVIENKLLMAETFNVAYEIMFTPVIVVNSKKRSYKTSLRNTKTFDRLSEVLDYLVKLE